MVRQTLLTFISAFAITMGSRKKGVKAAPYDPSSSSLFQSIPLPPLPDLLNGITNTMGNGNGKQSKSKDRNAKKGSKGGNGSDDIVQMSMGECLSLLS